MSMTQMKPFDIAEFTNKLITLAKECGVKAMVSEVLIEKPERRITYEYFEGRPHPLDFFTDRQAFNFTIQLRAEEVLVRTRAEIRDAM